MKFVGAANQIGESREVNIAHDPNNISKLEVSLCKFIVYWSIAPFESQVKAKTKLPKCLVFILEPISD